MIENIQTLQKTEHYYLTLHIPQKKLKINKK